MKEKSTNAAQPSEPAEMPTNVSLAQGDLLRQPVEVIVNAWNRNIIPWLLLLPQGVSALRTRFIT
jgi:hypothetical protein